jgi:outer membrane protein
MKKYVISLFFLTCLATLPLHGALAAEGVKLGYVDMQKVLNLSVAGKAAKEQLSEKVKKYQEQINKKQDELKKLKDVLEKQGSLLSEKAKSDKERDYQQGLKEFQRMTKDAQDDLQAKDEELTRRILGEIEKVVQDYGKQNNYSIIFLRNESMIYADEKSDLTDSVLKIFDAANK